MGFRRLKLRNIEYELAVGKIADVIITSKYPRWKNFRRFPINSESIIGYKINRDLRPESCKSDLECRNLKKDVEYGVKLLGRNSSEDWFDAMVYDSNSISADISFTDIQQNLPYSVEIVMNQKGNNELEENLCSVMRQYELT